MTCDLSLNPKLSIKSSSLNMDSVSTKALAGLYLIDPTDKAFRVFSVVRFVWENVSVVQSNHTKPVWTGVGGGGKHNPN